MEELKYKDLESKMTVMDELGRIGKIISIDDIDNILVSYGKGKTEYFSLRKDNPDGVSKLYKYE